MCWKYLFGRYGKTPLSLLIAEELKALGKKPVIVKNFIKITKTNIC